MKRSHLFIVLLNIFFSTQAKPNLTLLNKAKTTLTIWQGSVGTSLDDDKEGTWNMNYGKVTITATSPTILSKEISGDEYTKDTKLIIGIDEGKNEFLIVPQE